MVKDYIKPTERLNFKMNLIMSDFITQKEIPSLSIPKLVDYSGYECVGCGKISDDIAMNDGWTDKDFDNNSRTTIEGNWYCHIDCFRDSR